MIKEQDLNDVRLSRPVSITDLWDIDDRISRLEDAVVRLERVAEMLAELYLSERTKSWELILKEMLEQAKKEGRKDENRFG